MNVSSYKTRLLMITRDLSVQWEQTKEYWRDAKAQEFERHYLAELIAGVDRAATVIDEIDKAFNKIKKDCG
jgi:hypothetical protein